MPERGRELHGLLLVDKPEGLTSAGVVARVKRMLGQRKVGHLGTLDPFATGLLPICIGEGTKIAPFLADDEKRYVGEIVLGITTDTLDRTGTVVEAQVVPPFSSATLAAALSGLRGDILQTPPMYSALKRDGVPLYRLARAGQTIERMPRPVRIARFDVARTAPDRLRFAVTCSRGTYVRVLAHDLGRALGTGAQAAKIKVLSSNAAKSVLEELAPQFEKATQNKIAFTFDTAAALKGQIEKGAAFDLAVLTDGAIDDLIKRKAARPRKVATLRSTVLARIGKDAASNLDAVIAALIGAGYVTMDGEKVLYHFKSNSFLRSKIFYSRD